MRGLRGSLGYLRARRAARRRLRRRRASARTRTSRAATWTVDVVEAAFPVRAAPRRAGRAAPARAQRGLEADAERRRHRRRVLGALRAAGPRRPRRGRCGSSTTARAAASPPTRTRGRSAAARRARRRSSSGRSRRSRPATTRCSYRVAAGLDGKAKAVLAGGDRPAGSSTCQVSREPDAGARRPGQRRRRPRRRASRRRRRGCAHWRRIAGGDRAPEDRVPRRSMQVKCSPPSAALLVFVALFLSWFEERQRAGRRSRRSTSCSPCSRCRRAGRAVAGALALPLGARARVLPVARRR